MSDSCRVNFRTSDIDTRSPDFGSRIAVYWPLEHKLFPGNVNSINDDGKDVILYDEDEVETINLEEETWQYFNISDTVCALRNRYKLNLKHHKNAMRKKCSTRCLNP